jgi:uncharacterized membrane protein YqjE
MAAAARPISEVLHDIVGNVQDIVRSEFRLAKAEVTEEMGKLRSAGVLLGVGVLMVSFSAVFLLLAIVYALSLVMPAWAAALVVGVTLGAIAAVCCVLGIKRIKAVQAVPKTTASVKEDVEWAKQLTR